MHVQSVSGQHAADTLFTSYQVHPIAIPTTSSAPRVSTSLPLTGISGPNHLRRSHLWRILQRDGGGDVAGASMQLPLTVSGIHKFKVFIAIWYLSISTE